MSDSPLLTRPGDTVVLPSLYLAPPAYYAAALRFGNVLIDTAMRYDKRRKAVHRCTIVDTRGPLSLTVPVSVPHGTGGPLLWDRVGVSSHGRWWHLHRTALESAYGRTPFFEFIIDRFDGVYSDPTGRDLSVTALNMAAHRAIMDVLELWNGPKPACSADGQTVDLRRCNFDFADIPPYRQIRADRLGFHPVSMFDLICNLGPDSLDYLAGLQLPDHVE